MSDDMKAKARALLAAYPHGDAMASHVLTLEARLDVALRGALQSREEMREWLGSEDAGRAVCDVLYRVGVPFAVSELILEALIAAMPGGDA